MWSDCCQVEGNLPPRTARSDLSLETRGRLDSRSSELSSHWPVRQVWWWAKVSVQIYKIAASRVWPWTSSPTGSSGELPVRRALEGLPRILLAFHGFGIPSRPSPQSPRAHRPPVPFRRSSGAWNPRGPARWSPGNRNPGHRHRPARPPDQVVESAQLTHFLRIGPTEVGIVVTRRPEGNLRKRPPLEPGQVRSSPASGTDVPPGYPPHRLLPGKSHRIRWPDNG
jgi:hypothetical protein